MAVITPSPEPGVASPGEAARPRESLADGILAACGLALAAAAVHFTAALEHSAEHPSTAVFLALLGCAQLLWAVALQRSPSRRLLLVGAGMSLAIVALWAVSRTSGIPVGPDPWRPEPVGALDAIATADEVVLALLAGLRLRFATPGPAVRHLHALAVCLVLLSAVSLTHLGHAH